MYKINIIDEYTMYSIHYIYNHQVQHSREEPNMRKNQNWRDRRL